MTYLGYRICKFCRGRVGIPEANSHFCTGGQLSELASYCSVRHMEYTAPTYAAHPPAAPTYAAPPPTAHPYVPSVNHPLERISSLEAMNQKIQCEACSRIFNGIRGIRLHWAHARVLCCDNRPSSSEYVCNNHTATADDPVCAVMYDTNNNGSPICTRCGAPMLLLDPDARVLQGLKNV